MPQVRVLSFAVSVDGYGAGPNQGLEDPHPVSVLTHHARPPLTMAGGTNFVL